MTPSEFTSAGTDLFQDARSSIRRVGNSALPIAIPIIPPKSIRPYCASTTFNPSNILERAA